MDPIRIETRVQVGNAKFDLKDAKQKVEADAREWKLLKLGKAVVNAVIGPIVDRVNLARLNKKVEKREQEQEVRTNILRMLGNDKREGVSKGYVRAIADTDSKISKIDSEIAKLKGTSAVQKLILQSGKERFVKASLKLQEFHADFAKSLEKIVDDFPKNYMTSDLPGLKTEIDAVVQKRTENAAAIRNTENPDEREALIAERGKLNEELQELKASYDDGLQMLREAAFEPVTEKLREVQTWVDKLGEDFQGTAFSKEAEELATLQKTKSEALHTAKQNLGKEFL